MQPYNGRPDRVLSSSSLVNSESPSGSSNILKTLSQPSQEDRDAKNFALFSILELALLDARAKAVSDSLEGLNLNSHPACDNPLNNYEFIESDQKRPSVQVVDFLQNKAMWLPEMKRNEVELEKRQFKVCVKSSTDLPINSSQLEMSPSQIGVMDHQKL